MNQQFFFASITITLFRLMEYMSHLWKGFKTHFSQHIEYLPLRNLFRLAQEWTSCWKQNNITMTYQLNHEVPAAKLFDLCFIEKTCRHNPEKIRIMLQTFINTIPVAVEQIQNAHHLLDFPVIKNTAHQIKPVLSYYAIVTLEKDINLIEQLAKEETNSPELFSKIQKLETVISQVVTDMKSNLLKN